jgi:hypothetical protein
MLVYVCKSIHCMSLADSVGVSRIEPHTYYISGLGKSESYLSHTVWDIQDAANVTEQAVAETHTYTRIVIQVGATYGSPYPQLTKN